MRRNTIQRQLILDTVRGQKSHPTAEVAYQLIRERYSDISLGTVYRNLSVLVEDGQIRRISVPQAADRFEGTLLPHYHIHCRRCGVFSDLDLDYLEHLNRSVCQKTGFLIEGHDIVFDGLCPGCAVAHPG